MKTIKSWFEVVVLAVVVIMMGSSLSVVGQEILGSKETAIMNCKHIEFIQNGIFSIKNKYRILIHSYSDEYSNNPINYSKMFFGRNVKIKITNSCFPEYEINISDISNWPNVDQDKGKISCILFLDDWHDIFKINWNQKVMNILISNNNNKITNIIDDPEHANGNFNGNIIYTLTITNLDYSSDPIVFIINIPYNGQAVIKNHPYTTLNEWSATGKK